MAQAKLPTALSLRKLLAEKSPELSSLAEAYSNAGFYHEALDCLTLADNPALLKKLAAVAVETGDVFVWRQALKLMGAAPTDSDIAEIKKNAVSLGKEEFAAKAEQLLVKVEG